MGALAGYALEASIGRGAMGEVWRARAPDGTTVAVKTAHPGAGHDAALRRPFELELRATARMDHPHIVWLYDHGVADGEDPLPVDTPWLLLEHCGGGTLAAAPPADWYETRRVLLQLLDALAHAHARGLIHRDLKPTNVLRPLPTDLRTGWKLADFGIARLVGEHLGPGAAGTPAYMAPEQAVGAVDAMGPWTDLFALGCLAWAIVAGVAPFKRMTVAQRLRMRVLPRLEPRFEVPSGLPDWIAPLLHPEPRYRVRAAADAARGLRDLGEPDSDASRAVTLRRAAGRRVQIRGWRAEHRDGPALAIQGTGLSLFSLRERPLIGRTEARDQLWTALRRVSSTAHPALVRVEGPVGAGRTALVRWLVRRAEELGAATTAMVTGHPDTPSVAPLKELWTQLLRLHDVPRERWREVQRTRLHQAGVPEPTVAEVQALLDQDGDDWGAARPLRDALSTLARAQPLLLAIDDAQHLPALMRLLLLLGSEGEGAILGVVVVDAEPLTPEDTLTGHVPWADTVSVGPMDPDELDALARQLLGMDPVTRSAIARRTGTLPGQLVDRISHWVREGLLVPGDSGFHVQGDPSALPLRAGPWRARTEALLHELPTVDGHALERAAALGDDVDEFLWGKTCDDPLAGETVSHAMRLQPQAVQARARAVERLLVAGLALETDRGFVFAHSEVRATLLDRARAGRRLQSHHLACAAHLAREPGSESTLRRGYALLAGGRPEEAARALIRGTRRTLQIGNIRVALDALAAADRALDACGDLDTRLDRGRVHLLRAEAAHELGHMRDARVEAEAALALSEALDHALLRRSAHLRLGDVAVFSQDWQSAEPHLRAYMDECAGDRQARIGLGQSRLAHCLELRGDAEGAQRMRLQATETFQRVLFSEPGRRMRLQDLATYCAHLTRIRESEAAARTAHQLITEAERTGELGLLKFGWSKLLEARREQGLHAEAAEAGEQCLKIARLRGDVRTTVLMAVNLAHELRLLGRLERARTVLTGADREIPHGEIPGLEAPLLASLAHVCALQGAWEETEHYRVHTESVARALPRWDPKLGGELEETALACESGGEADLAARIREGRRTLERHLRRD